MAGGGSKRKRGRPQARGARFLSRYPVLLIVPVSALFLGIGYAYAARLAASWSTIHGAKAAVVVAGAAVGVGLVVAAIAGARQGGGPWLLLPGAVLIAGIVVTRPQIAPPAGSPGRITTGFEAAAFALLSVVWFVCAFAFLGLLPRMWRSRMAFSRPERGLHITRAPRGSETAATPIPLTEWRQFAESRDDLAAFDPQAEDPSLAATGRPADGKPARRHAATERQLRASQDLILTRPDLIARNPALARALPPGFPVYTFTYRRSDGSLLYLTWLNGEVIVAGVGRDRAGDIAILQPIAWALGAHLVDDNGKVYEHV